MQEQGKQKRKDKQEINNSSVRKDVNTDNRTEDERCMQAAEAMVYTGSYPRHELVAARKTLVRSIQCQRSTFWKILKNKLGIFEDGTWLAFHNPDNHSSSLYSGFNRGNVVSNKMSDHEECDISVGMDSEKMNQSNSFSVGMDSEKMNQSNSFSEATCENKTVTVAVKIEKQERTRNLSKHSEDRISTGRATRRLSASPYSFIIDRVGQRTSLLPATDLNENVTVMQALDRAKQNLATSSKANEKVNICQTGVGVSENRECTEEKSEIKTKTCYQCDLCPFIACQAKMTLKHMKENLHYSASKVLAAAACGNLIPKEVLKIMALKHQPALYKNLVPICPGCNLCFPNIYVCSQHYVETHALSGEKCYSVGKERSELDILVDINDFKCKLCPYQGPRLSNWNKHMQSHKELDYQRPEKDEVMICFCPYCLLGPSDYHSCLSHIICKHKKTKTAFAIRAAFVKKSATRYQMLPLRLKANSKPEDVMKTELRMVRKIKKVSKRDGKASRQLCEMLNRQIEDLKQLVK